METELNELLKEQEILRGMKASCMDFDMKLNQKIGEFLEKHFSLKKEDSFTVLDLIKKAKET